MNTGGASESSSYGLPPIKNVLAEVLAPTCAMPSWQACEMENTSWDGTTEENVRKYVSSVGEEQELSG